MIYRTALFSMILNDHCTQFQGHAILWRWISQKRYEIDIVSLKILIGTYTRFTQHCHFEWPWVILSDLAKASMTWSIARSLRQLSFLFTDIWRFSYLQNGGRPPSWICYDVTILHRRTHFRCPNIVLKFYVDRFCSFRDTCNIVCGHFGCT